MQLLPVAGCERVDGRGPREPESITMIEHFELLEGARRGIESRYGGAQNTPCACSLAGDCAEVERSKFIRLSESFPDVARIGLSALRDLCQDARRSDWFFRTVDARNQWLRTVIGHEDMHPRIWTELESYNELLGSIIFHSNTLPYDPFWPELWGSRDGENASTPFPSCMLKSALDEGNSLKTKLRQWSLLKGSNTANRRTEKVEDGDWEPGSPRKFLTIFPDEVKLVRELAKGSDGIISLVIWRGGWFVQKEGQGLQTSFDAEVKVVKRFSHPHIICSFGAQGPENQPSAYFMEYMAHDLFSFIVDRERPGVGANQPPFSHPESVDVLLQIAEAMRHMHGESVVHCDLKSLNILLSQLATSQNVRRLLVKVADFGSARVVDASSEFVAGRASTNYAAPEVLRQRSDGTVLIPCPYKIDVYSFGVVAFEVLTGKNNAADYKRSPSEFKVGVVTGTVRPRLRDECRRHKGLTQDEELISLVEKCWHGDPAKRPCFVEICEELEKTRDRIAEQMLRRDNPKRKVDFTWLWGCFKGLRSRGKQAASSSSSRN